MLVLWIFYDPANGFFWITIFDGKGADIRAIVLFHNALLDPRGVKKAHREIDLKNPKSNTQSAGFTPEEREKMTCLLDSGFTDTFRFVHGDVTGIYSWWSYMYHARENNAGWRIDYFLVSRRLESAIAGAEILTQVMGSDHCPVVLELDEEKISSIN